MTSTFFLRMALVVLTSAGSFFAFLWIGRFITSLSLERKTRIVQRLHIIRRNLWLWMLDSAELVVMVAVVILYLAGFALMSGRP